MCQSCILWELEDALERNITQFLLELGNGFAFMGRQKEILISGVTRRIDLLFYHIRLRCYVVVLGVNSQEKALLKTITYPF